MSVHTEADDALSDAQHHIHEATRKLSRIVVDLCYGHDEYTKEKRAEINAAFLTLIKLRETL